ncbi:MAG TPA: twin-arginine translocation signal domain-containing protein [Kofleriaceae bacterium]|nr:twin-arginine translocation signal domain-containing protein [Kofleriaceae bacterium]
MSNGTSRRGFLKRAAIAAGAFGISRVPGVKLLGRAEAAAGDEAPALFILNLVGGYNALFPSADSFVGTGAFGVTSSNIKQIGTSDVFVDRATLGTLSGTTLSRMASIGVNHGISAHPTARQALLLDGDKSRLVRMSVALGGTAAVRCVVVGGLMPEGVHRAVGDVSLQQVRDLSTTIAVLGGSSAATAPERAPAADGIAAAEAMSRRALDKNPTSGKSLIEGYPAASAQLRQTAVALDYAGLAAAYGVTPGTGGSLPTNITNTTMQIMGAELMIQAGANVVIANQRGWDSHGDNNGQEVRRKLLDDGTMAALKVFTDRTLALTDRNVVTVIIGDFSRSLPGSNHQANLTATVIGKHVQLGTTGRVTSDVGLRSGTPGIQGLWAYLSAVLKTADQPFGANPHGLVVP